MLYLHGLQPKQSIGEAVESVEQRLLLLGVGLGRVGGVFGREALIDAEEEVDLAEVSAVALLMFGEVLFQPGNATIFIGHLLVDQFLDLLVLVLVIGSDDAKDILEIGGALIEESEVGVGVVRVVHD